MRLFLTTCLVLVLAACAPKGGGSDNTSKPTPTPTPTGVPLIDAPPWTPNVPGTGASNHDSTIVVSKSTQQSGSIKATGLHQATDSSRIATFTIDMSQDLGAHGSLTLVAQTVSFSDSSLGSAFPYLISLSDGTHEYINLAAACATQGYYTCGSTSCTPNTSCVINSPSAYFDRDHWEEHQSQTQSADNSPSVNTFPTCNWTGGSTTDPLKPACAFGSSLPAPLPTGTYTAKYILLSDSQDSISSATATIDLTVVKKSAASTGGAVDLNVFLVGTNNINQSRTAKGQQNLNSLVGKIAEIYQQTNVGVKIGNVNAIETTGLQSNGDQFAALPIDNIGDLLATSGTIAPAGSEGKAINIFLVSSIVDNSQSEFTILGFDGGIGGPTLNGTAQSGLVVASFDELEQFNGTCPPAGATCPTSSFDPDFLELAGVIVHEMGHFFGLNHLSELDGTVHDFIFDTPVCTATDNTTGGTATLTINSCLNIDTNIYPGTSKSCHQACTTYNASQGKFCPTKAECEFNYVMWWTVRNFVLGGSGDGLLFSPDSGILIRYNPFVQ